MNGGCFQKKNMNGGQRRWVVSHFMLHDLCMVALAKPNKVPIYDRHKHVRTPITRSCRTITCMHLMSSHAIAMHAETSGSRIRHDDVWHYDVHSESTSTVYFSNPSNHWRSINLEISCSWPCCLLRFIIRILCTFFMHAYVSSVCRLRKRGD